MRISCVAALLFAALLMGCVGVSGAGDAPLAHALDLEIATEHIAWANPLAAGAVRVVLVAPRHTLRDGAEFAQRFEVELEAVALWNRTHLGYDPSLPQTHVPGGAAEEVLSRLREQLARDPHVVILANFALETLPVEIWSDLYRRVGAGMGLVLVNHDPPPGDIVYETFIDALTPAEEDPVNFGVGAEATAEWAQVENAAFAATYGDGRVVTLGYGPDRPETHCLIPALTKPILALPEYFDNYLALMGRAVLWAAGRDVPLRVTGIEQLVREGPDEEEIPPELPEEFVQAMRDSVLQEPIKRFVVRADRPAERDYTVRVQVRDPNRSARTVYSDLPDWKEGAQEYLVEFLSGPGLYFLDIWLETRKGVAAWHTAAVEVQGWPTFKDLRLSKEVLLPNDAVDLSVEVRALAGNARPFTLYARGVDNFDRLVAEAWAPAPEGGGRTGMRLPFSDLIGRRVRLEVYAVDGPPHFPGLWELNMSACEVRLLPVRQPRDTAAAGAMVCAEAAHEYNARRLVSQLRDLGADAVYTTDGEGAHRHILGLGMRPVGSVAEVRAAAAAEGLRREPCLSDEAFRTRERQRITELASYYARGGLLDYGVGNPAYLCASDENVCHSAHCLEAYRNLLRTRYSDIATLNAAWGTKYAGFAGIVPYDAAQARQEDRFAPWVSFRVFMAGVFANHLRMTADAVAAADSHARTGARLLRDGKTAYGYDTAALAQTLPLLCVPPAPCMLHTLASHHEAGARSGVAWEADARDDAAYARWLPWRAALLGLPETWLVEPYGTATMPRAHTLLRADGAPTPTLAAFGKSLALLGAGYGDVLREASPVESPVAVVTSLPARYLHAAWADDALDYTRNLDKAVALLEHMGYTPDVLTVGELAAGDLSAYQALVLPMASALPQGACGALRAFVERGGLLVADLAPGTYDDMGAPFNSYHLAETLGVAVQAGAAVLVEDVPRVRLPAGEEEVTEGRLAPLPVDTRVSTAGAEGFAEEGMSPVWLRTAQTLLLNHPFPSREETGNHLAVRALLTHIFGEAGIEPPLHLDADFDGARRTFALDDTRIHALVARWDATGTQRLRLRAGKDRELTDLLHGDAAASTRSVRLALAPGETALVSDLAYEVSAVEVAAPQRVTQGERLPVAVHIATSGEAGTHPVRICLETGMGATLPHYTTTLWAKGGNGETFIPLARNEAIGTYFLRAHDLLSGLESRILVQVLQRTEHFD